MANTAGFLSTTELDFTTLKQNLKTFLSSQSQFADYDFEGSNINVLLDILSYNTYLNNFYLNMVGSEMFLDTAQLRESVVSHAKELNYIPRSRTSAEAFVNITITPGDTPDNIVIPKNYKLTTTIDNTSYNFFVGEDRIVVANNGAYIASNVAIYEGSLVTEYFNVTANSSFILQSENLDTRSIGVEVYQTNTSAIAYTYNLADSLYGLTSTSNVFFINGYASNQYQVVFGDGISGRNLQTGNFVKVVYRDTAGGLGNGAYNFSKSVAIDGYSTITVATVTSAANGSERETNDSIKFNAPRFFTTQNRAVTSEDYINLVKAKFPQFQAVYAYGGEETTPPQYGKAIIVIKPFGSIAIIPDYLKTEIKNYLNLKSLVTEPMIVDPDYIYVQVISNVKYNTQATTLSTPAIRSKVQQAILTYANNNLDQFGDDLSYSKLVSSIDESDISIIGNETDAKVIKRWVPPVEQSNTITFSYNNPLYQEQYLYELPQGHELIVESSVFKYVSGTSTYNAYIGDNGLGTIKVYTDQTNNSIITRISLNDNAGTVNYTTGDVTITANIFSYSGSYISIYGKLQNKDILVDRDGFVLISSSDLVITINPIVI